ncbi:hypothetical protein GCM10012319_71250 [Comamonas sp. KCTC 72670]|nr:hypothetical protein GCM10012319_71250 [Comamonas sp. KCTC 72670]
MAGRAQYAAELLAGTMPQDIDAVFRAAGVSLFPRSREELVTNCTCPDWGDPCKHVAATHYVLGEALDRDPFLLFELRGWTKARVLDALRAARGGEPRTAVKRKRAASADGEVAPVPRGVKPGKLTRADYDLPRKPLPAMGFSFDAPSVHGAVLRQLGSPASWGVKDTPGDMLSSQVQAAAEGARRIALRETDSRDEVPAARKPRR